MNKSFLLKFRARPGETVPMQAVWNNHPFLNPHFLNSGIFFYCWSVKCFQLFLHLQNNWFAALSAGNTHVDGASRVSETRSDPQQRGEWNFLLSAPPLLTQLYFWAFKILSVYLFIYLGVVKCARHWLPSHPVRQAFCSRGTFEWFQEHCFMS